MRTDITPDLPAIVTSRQLAEFGLTPARIRGAVSTGTLYRVRRGVFCTERAPTALVRAARMGGSLTDVSALRLFGVWARPDQRLHVQLPHALGHVKDPDTGAPFTPRPDVVAHWSRAGPAVGEPGVVAASSALRLAAETWALPEAVAAIDSALHRRLVTRAELELTFTGSGRAGRCLARTDARAESGTESVARVRFAEAGIDCAIQVWMTASIRVDLLIDGWLVVEVDSREFHGTADDSSRDYRRDALLTRLGCTVLHVDYEQVLFDWPAVLTMTRQVLFGGRAAVGARSPVPVGWAGRETP